MNILAANDDGIDCEGIRALVDSLKKAGHTVLAAAPDRERSGSSHAMTMASGVEVKEVEKGFWAVRGTPVDCIVAAFSGVFDFKPDIVVSGINAGANLGTDLIFSGTAAAARQAALSGIPAIAFSLTGLPPYDFNDAADWAAYHVEELAALWETNLFININFPQCHIEAAVKWTRAFPARRRYADKVRTEEGKEGWKKLVWTDITLLSDDETGSDSAITASGGIALSRIKIEPEAV